MLYPILEQYDVDIEKALAYGFVREGAGLTDTAQDTAGNRVLRCRYACRQGLIRKCFGTRYR